MPFEYGGVTPVRIVDTTDLQASEKMSMEKGKLVKSTGGVCLAMVADWILKCQQSPLGIGVTSASQLKSGQSLAFAQTAYSRDVFSKPGGTEAEERTAFLVSQGLTVVGEVLRSKKTGVGDAHLQRIAIDCVGLTGYAVISILGKESAHAFGFRQRSGLVQFLDPNLGILGFQSANDFSRWFPSFVTDNYEHLMQAADLARVAS